VIRRSAQVQMQADRCVPVVVKINKEERVGNRLSRGVLRGGTLLSICAVAGTCAVSAGAATVVPVSRTGCHGSLAADSSGKAQNEPLSYSFHCNGGITAYSIIVNQNGDHNAAIDDFSNAPSVFETDDATPSPTETVSCEGVLPSDGINCNTGALGSQISDGFYVAGTVDPVQAYCEHLPTVTAKGKPVKPGAAAIPTAIVQLVVTDYTGAEDGPFSLKLSKACPTVRKVVPANVKTTTTTTVKSSTKKMTTKKEDR
jgi:hypothetical protein